MKEIIFIYVVSLINLLFLFLAFYVGMKFQKEIDKSKDNEELEKIKEDILETRLIFAKSQEEQYDRLTNFITTNFLIENANTEINVDEDDELEKHFGDTEERKQAINDILDNLNNYDGDESGKGQKEIKI